LSADGRQVWEELGAMIGRRRRGQTPCVIVYVATDVTKRLRSKRNRFKGFSTTTIRRGETVSPSGANDRSPALSESSKYGRWIEVFSKP
jgi:hypothetical protein